jgi:hypothetical protein
MAILPGVVIGTMDVNGAWIGAIDFVQVSFP